MLWSILPILCRVFEFQDSENVVITAGTIEVASQLQREHYAMYQHMTIHGNLRVTQTSYGIGRKVTIQNCWKYTRVQLKQEDEFLFPHAPVLSAVPGQCDAAGFHCSKWKLICSHLPWKIRLEEVVALFQNNSASYSVCCAAAENGQLTGYGICYSSKQHHSSQQ